MHHAPPSSVSLCDLRGGAPKAHTCESACASVLHTRNWTPVSSRAIMLLTALPPAPPTPTTEIIGRSKLGCGATCGLSGGGGVTSFPGSDCAAACAGDAAGAAAPAGVPDDDACAGPDGAVGFFAGVFIQRCCSAGAVRFHADSAPIRNETG